MSQLGRESEAEFILSGYGALFCVGLSSINLVWLSCRRNTREVTVTRD